MLSNSSEKEGLDIWRKRVGEAEAEKITRIAAATGTAYHQLGEDYLLGKPLSKQQWLAELLFKKTIPLLKANVTKVHAVEIPLFSKVLRLAGRTDALVDWNNEFAVFDYKCINNNDPQYLTDYWIQTSIYGHMVKEMYGIEVKKLVLVVAHKRSLKVRIFHERPYKYSKQAVERIKAFREKIA
jgi:genome maintenance exonuclease 1